MADEIRVINGSNETIPVIVTVGEVDQQTGFKVQLVPFVTGIEDVDLSENAAGWQAAPVPAAGFAPGYYCTYTGIGSGSTWAPEHAGHVRIIGR